MSNEKRFHISADGKTLTDRKKDEKYAVAGYRIIRNWKTTSVIFNENIPDKKHLTIARHTIDETDFTFGPAMPLTGPGRKNKKHSASPGPKGAASSAPSEGVSFTKQELVDLHQAHLHATNLTLKKVTAQIRGSADSQMSSQELLELHEYHVKAAVLTLQKLAPFLR